MIKTPAKMKTLPHSRLQYKRKNEKEKLKDKK